MGDLSAVGDAAAQGGESSLIGGMGLTQRADISRAPVASAPVAAQPLGGVGSQMEARTRDMTGGLGLVLTGDAIRLTPEWFDARDRDRWLQWVDISGLRRAEDGSGPGIAARLRAAVDRVDLNVPSRPWGPYRAIQLQPVLTNDLDPRSAGGGPAPDQAQEWYARRQVAIIRMRDVLNNWEREYPGRPLFECDAWFGRGRIASSRNAPGWGVLNEEMDREGITREEQTTLRFLPDEGLIAASRAYINNMSMMSPFLSAQIVEWQRVRDRAIRELSAVVGRGTHDPGSANWRGAVNYHFDNAGITAAERDVLLAGNVTALAKMNPISPFALLWGKAIVEPLNPNALNIEDLTPGAPVIKRGDGSCQCPTRQYFTQIVSPMPLGRFIDIMLTTETGARVVAEDNAIRVREGLAGRGTTYFNTSRGMDVTAAENEFYRLPLDSTEVELPLGAMQPAPFFSYQWTFFRNSPYLNASTLANGDAFILPDREIIVAPACPERGPEPRRQADWKKESVQVFLRGPGSRMFPGPMIDHYCDLSVARWWFEIALALATDNRIIARLDAASPDNGLFPEQADQSGPWNPIGWYAQTYYVRAIAEAIANGYNAMNLPWYIDPVARALYRDWFAGHEPDEYNIRANYNDRNWFTNTEQCNEKRYTVLRARIQQNSWENTAVGQMPALLSRMWNVTHPDSNDRRTLEFIQKAGVMLWGGNVERDPYTAPNAYNRGFASGFAMGWDVFFASPLALPREPTDAERRLYVGSRKRPGQGAVTGASIGAAIGSILFPGVGTAVGALIGGAAGGSDVSDTVWDLSDSKPTLPQTLLSEDWYASIIHAPPLQDRNNICDWRAGGFDPAGIAGVHVQGTVPLRWYVAWLREWAMACTTIEPVSQQPAAEMPTVSAGRRWAGFAQGNMPRRDVGTILRASKTYAMDINMTWGAQLGGQQRFAEFLGQKAREFGAAQPNATIRMVGGIVGQLGGTAVSIATMVGAPTPPIPGAAPGGAQGGQEGAQGGQEGAQGGQEGQQSSQSLGQAAGAMATAGVGLVTELLANAFPNYDCASYGRDDLGRAKPNFERTSLSGDVFANTPPTLTLPLPSGFCRTTEPLPPFVEMPPPPPPPPPVQTEPDGLSNIAKVGLAVAGVGAVAAVAYFVANRPKAT